MRRNGKLFRAFVSLLATMQIVVSGGAPALEAFADAASVQYVGEGNLHEAPQHAHDASSCPVCRVLDSPALLEAKRDGERATAATQEYSAYHARIVSHTAHAWLHSRAPPANS